MRSLYVAVVIIISGLVISCSSADKMKLGKLYTMQELLHEAEADCRDPDAVLRAVNWAVYGIQDLHNSRAYMDRGGETYTATRYLERHLSLLTARRNPDPELMCERIAQVRKATDEYLSKSGELQFAAVKDE